MENVRLLGSTNVAELAEYPLLTQIVGPNDFIFDLETGEIREFGPDDYERVKNQDQSVTHLNSPKSLSKKMLE